MTLSEFIGVLSLVLTSISFGYALGTYIARKK